VDLFEYQAKQLFAAHDVPVGLGEVADTPEQAQAIAERIGEWSSSRLRSRPVDAAKPAA